MNCRTYVASFVSLISMLAPTCLAQDVSEPICIREFLESPDRNGLAEHVKRIGGSYAFDLMLVLQGEFPSRAEAFSIKLIYSQRSDSAPDSPNTASITYSPHDHTRQKFGKNIRFVGKIRGKKVADLIQLAKRITENQKFGIQSKNQENLLIGGPVEAYYLIQSSLINPRSGSLAGGWIANPQTKTVSWEFLSLAYEVRDLVRSAAEKAYPEWEGNLDMDQDDYNIKDEIVAETPARIEESTNKSTAEQPGPAQPATKAADKVPPKDQPSTPTSKDSPR